MRTAMVTESSTGQLVAAVRDSGRLECVVAGPAEGVLGALLGLGFAQDEVQGVPERWKVSCWDRIEPGSLVVL